MAAHDRLDDWPEGLIIAQLYADTYGIPYEQALELVEPAGADAGGWNSGPCVANPDHPLPGADSGKS